MICDEIELNDLTIDMWFSLMGLIVQNVISNIPLPCFDITKADNLDIHFSSALLAIDQHDVIQEWIDMYSHAYLQRMELLDIYWDIYLFHYGDYCSYVMDLVKCVYHEL